MKSGAWGFGLRHAAHLLHDPPERLVPAHGRLPFLADCDPKGHRIGSP